MAKCLIHYKLCMLKYCSVINRLWRPKTEWRLYSFINSIYFCKETFLLSFFFHYCFFIFFVCVWLAVGLVVRHCEGRVTSYHGIIVSWASTACKQDFGVLNNMSQDLLTQPASTHCQQRACKWMQLVLDLGTKFSVQGNLIMYSSMWMAYSQTQYEITAAVC